MTLNYNISPVLIIYFYYASSFKIKDLELHHVESKRLEKLISDNQQEIHDAQRHFYDLTERVRLKLSKVEDEERGVYCVESCVA